MSLPQPAVAIDSICSVVWNNTIYTYSANAFQSLSLTTGAKWKKLAPGESVTGGVCVGSTPADASQAGFFVVGGMSATATYPGLQKFTYATGQWATITPESLVTQSRLSHGAAYINSTDSILMYAGVQDGSASVSQQTFAIQASAPYGVVSYQSTAPAAINPYVLPWSNSQAVMVGGGASNTQVMLFDPANGGWLDSGASLASPFTIATSGMQVALVTGDDNSKNLYTFDETVSPNQVGRIVLVDGAGTPVANAGPAKRSVYDDNELMEDDVALFRRAALTQTNWPAYNASLAPTTTRTNFGIAQGADGRVVIAGGTTGQDVLCIFDGRTNGWQNVTKLLVQQKKVTTSSTSSSSSTSSTSSTSLPSTLLTAASSTSSSVAATPTASVAATSSAAVAAPVPTASTSLSANALLGIVLGSVAGVGVILLALYLLLMRGRRKRQQQQQLAAGNNGHNRNMSGQSPSEKSMSAIANDSLTRPPGGGGVFRGGHQAQDSMGSITSVGIMMGRVNQPRQPETKHSNLAHATSFKGTISRPILQTGQDASNFGNSPPRQIQSDRNGIGAGAAAAATNAYGRSVTNPRESQQQNHDGNGNGTRRSSGWNRYWSGGSALNLLGFGSGNNAKRATVASDTSSNYSSNNLTSSVAGVGIGGNGYSSRNSDYNNKNRITQDSATVPPLEIPSMPEAKPRFQRVNSGSPTIANYEHYIKHGTMFEGMTGTIERSNSQASSRSGYSSGIPASVHEAWDPTSSSDDRPWGSDRAPSSAYGPSPTPYYPTAAAARMGSTPSPNPFQTTQAPAINAANTYNGSSSNKKYVPTGLSQQPQLSRADTSNDMSWLNLGDVSRV